MIRRLFMLLVLMCAFAAISNLLLGDTVTRQLYGRETGGRKHVQEAVGMIYATVGGAVFGAIVFGAFPSEQRPPS